MTCQAGSRSLQKIVEASAVQPHMKEFASNERPTAIWQERREEATYQEMSSGVDVQVRGVENNDKINYASELEDWISQHEAAISLKTA